MAKPATPKSNFDPNAPLTQPSELMALFGRFFLTIMFMMFCITFLIGEHKSVALFFGLLSLILQIMTVRMWRRLRDERLARKAEREKYLSETVQAGGTA